MTAPSQSISSIQGLHATVAAIPFKSKPQLPGLLALAPNNSLHNQYLLIVLLMNNHQSKESKKTSNVTVPGKVIFD